MLSGGVGKNMFALWSCSPDVTGRAGTCRGCDDDVSIYRGGRTFALSSTIIMLSRSGFLRT